MESDIRVNVLPVTRPLAGYNLYRDYHIAFLPAGEQPETCYRLSVSVGTLTFLVDAWDLAFFSVDAYIPRHNWITVPGLLPPSIYQVGKVIFLCDFNGDGIASIHSPIHPICSEDYHILVLALGKGRASRYIQVASCLIFGLAQFDILKEIWFLDLRLRDEW